MRDVNGFVGRRPEHTGLPNGGDFLGGQQGKYWPLAHIHHDAAVCHDASTSKRTLLEQINQTNKQQKAYQKEYDVFSLADNNVNTFTWKKKTWSFESKYSILYEICNCISMHLGEQKASHWKNRSFS